MEFTLTIEEVEPGRSCRQTLEGDLDVRIPVLGRLVERIIADSLHRVYSGIPAIVEQCASPLLCSATLHVACVGVCCWPHLPF